MAESSAIESTLKADPFAGLPTIFRDCIDRGNDRFDLATPWRKDDWVYATDGRIAVRIAMATLPMPYPEPEPSRRVPKSIDGTFARHPEVNFQEAPAELPDVGDGKEECPCCRERTMPAFDAVKVGGVTLAACYVALLRWHGASVYLPKEPSANQPVRFTLGVCEGLVMPMSPDQEEA